MRKGLTKILITGGVAFMLSSAVFSSKAFATETKDFTKYPDDVSAPYGRVIIEGGTVLNNITYVDSQDITVSVYASDDKCEIGEIKYYLSTSSLTATKIPDSEWKTYRDGEKTSLTLPNATSTHTIYVAFKDYNGNISIVSTATNQTITYNLNGGSYNGSTTDLTGVDVTRKYGAPFIITNRIPKKEGLSFLGWSTDPEATAPSYKAGDLILPEMVISSDTLYAVFTTEKVGILPLSEIAEVGDYVNYPVTYTNVATDGRSYIAKLNGWRVLSIEDDGTVNLVSAGVPLTYQQSSNGTETSIKNLIWNFLDIPISTINDSTSNYKFRTNGFNPNKTLTEIFNNKYTARYEQDTEESYTSMYNSGTVVTYTGTKKAGDLKVRSMTKEDLDKVYDPTGATVTPDGISVTSAKYNSLLAIPVTNSTSSYAYYLLASAYNNAYLRLVSSNGNVLNSGLSGSKIGVRPVVSLKPEVLAVDKDAVGAWNITIEE